MLNKLRRENELKHTFSACLWSAAASALALAKCLSVYVKFFFVMGKGLTGKLSCPWRGLVTFECGCPCALSWGVYKSTGYLVKNTTPDHQIRSILLELFYRSVL